MSLTQNKRKNKINKNKKAVSIMIGYVILIGITMVIAGITYAWLQTYVPKDKLECPEGTSIFIQDISCSTTLSKINLEIILENNGRFNIDGYFIRATNDSTQEIATIDLSKYSGQEQNGYITFPGTSPLEPNTESTTVFNIPLSETGNLERLEIIPLRIQERKFANCPAAKITETLSDKC